MAEQQSDKDLQRKLEASLKAITVGRIKEPAKVYNYIRDRLENAEGVTIRTYANHMPSFTYHVDPGAQDPFADDQLQPEEYEGKYSVDEQVVRGQQQALGDVEPDLEAIGDERIADLSENERKRVAEYMDGIIKSRNKKAKTKA